MFPKWTNGLKAAVGGGVVVAALYVTAIITFGFSPAATDVGFAPVQPVPYSHAVHAGKLGIDCRYCHSTVESAAFAAIPSTQTCMGCHTNIRQTEKLAKVRESYATGEPVHWVKVHDLPDYAYFNHSAHVRRGVGCVECHGRVDHMEVVYKAQPLSMAWCLDCHRNPDKRLRPQDVITKMDWVPDEDPAVLGARLRKENDINPSTDCTTCHR
ncbi:MAG: cytochrome c3 family protein [Phycisphaerae bacterium]